MCGNQRALDLGKGKRKFWDFACRVDGSRERWRRWLGKLMDRANERLEARGVDDLIVLAEPSLGNRFLGQAYRQQAKRTTCLQILGERASEQLPEVGADLV